MTIGQGTAILHYEIDIRDVFSYYAEEINLLSKLATDVMLTTDFYTGNLFRYLDAAALKFDKAITRVDEKTAVAAEFDATIMMSNPTNTTMYNTIGTISFLNTFISSMRATMERYRVAIRDGLPPNTPESGVISGVFSEILSFTSSYPYVLIRTVVYNFISMYWTQVLIPKITIHWLNLLKTKQRSYIHIENSGRSVRSVVIDKSTSSFSFYGTNIMDDHKIDCINVYSPNKSIVTTSYNTIKSGPIRMKRVRAKNDRYSIVNTYDQTDMYTLTNKKTKTENISCTKIPERVRFFVNNTTDYEYLKNRKALDYCNIIDRIHADDITLTSYGMDSILKSNLLVKPTDIVWNTNVATDATACKSYLEAIIPKFDIDLKNIRDAMTDKHLLNPALNQVFFEDQLNINDRRLFKSHLNNSITTTNNYPPYNTSLLNILDNMKSNTIDGTNNWTMGLIKCSLIYSKLPTDAEFPLNKRSLLGMMYMPYFSKFRVSRLITSNPVLSEKYTSATEYVLDSDVKAHTINYVDKGNKIVNSSLVTRSVYEISSGGIYHGKILTELSNYFSPNIKDILKHNFIDRATIGVNTIHYGTD